MKRKETLKNWELALILSVSLTLCHSAVPAYWWGVIFPGLTPEAPAQVETANMDGVPANGESSGAVKLRFQLLDWINGLRA